VALADPHTVNGDITGRPESVVMDLELTRMLGPRFVKVFGWHDNETGYAARLCDLVVDLVGRI
jgi:glyceraldehyde 3-phosphate dehydrogenase